MNRPTNRSLEDYDFEAALETLCDILKPMYDVIVAKNGHPQGDSLLAATAAEYAKALMRAGDFVVRYGGEEFAVLLPGTHINGTLRAAEYIRVNIENMVVKCSDGTETNVTVRQGI